MEQDILVERTDQMEHRIAELMREDYTKKSHVSIGQWLLGFAAVVLVIFMTRSSRRQEIKTVDYVDLARYMGKWYEIARIPYRYEWGCYASSAEYTMMRNGQIKVVNSCRQNSLEGPGKSAEAKAWVVDPKTNAKLKVQFGIFAVGDYWILDLDPDYRYAMVGTSDRDHLWILSRMPTMDETIYSRLVAKATDMGYHTSKLLRTPQPATEAMVV